MKFVHIADLHLGKVIHQYSLLEIQKELLFELLTYMDQKDIRILVIAGDVYDRLIPSQEAVNLLDEFLSQAIQVYHIEVFMISGNHDSSDRLHFASRLLASQGLHIETYPKETMAYIEKEHTRFYMLPFMKPSQVKNLFDEQDIHTYQDAFQVYMKHQKIDSNYHNILITHQFVGHASITSASEIPLSVGGSEIIDASLFQDFDYVALGHLHAPQKVSRDTIRYSGSLMPYSFDEVNQEKSITVVDTDDFSIHIHKLHPTQTLKTYQGTFEQFMDPQFIEDKNHFLSFVLEDTILIPHAIDQLRTLYPYLLQITYARFQQQGEIDHVRMQAVKQMDTNTLFKKFYYDMKHEELNEQQRQIIEELLVIQELIEKVGENE